MLTLILATLLAQPLEAIPEGWHFDPPWLSSYEQPYYGLEAPSSDGHCVEVCYYINGIPMGCSPMEKENNGMVVCKEKMARTEGFEMAMDIMVETAQFQVNALQNELAVWDKKADTRKKDKAVLILTTQLNQIVQLLNAFEQKVKSEPQEVRPTE